MASSPIYKARVCETSTTTGTGTLTLGGAVTGYQTWAAVGNGNSAQYYIEAVDGSGVPTGDWEEGIGTYTSSGTTLSRDIVTASSNSGSAVSFSAGTKRVGLTAPSSVTALPVLGDMGGRLTLTTGVPVTTSDVTAAGTIYYTPFKHNRVELWNGFGWSRYAFSELSLALTATSGKPYDVFLYDNAGTLTLETLVWTNDTTRATALVMQDGVLCKTGALTRRYVGSFYASGTNTTEDSEAKRYLWNKDNRVLRPMNRVDTTDSWSYTTNTWRQANASASNQVDYLAGLSEDAIMATVVVGVNIGGNSTYSGGVAVGIDSTSSPSGIRGCFYLAGVATVAQMTATGSYIGFPGVGKHSVVWLEKGADTSCLFFGDDGGTGVQSGITGTVWG